MSTDPPSVDCPLPYAGVSVLIPAHNEAGVIEQCLGSVLRQTIRRRVRIVVVPNGCTDGTAEAVRAMIPAAAARGFELLVKELVQGCKPDALNLADRFALPGVRVYLDADIRLSPDALESVVAELESGRAHLCAPALRVAPASSFSTRCYCAVWGQLPAVTGDVIGCGLYAVSAAGRERWDLFPRIISDDKFARLNFTPQERRVAPRGTFTIQMPEGLRELVQVRGRWCRGNRELVETVPSVGRRERPLWTHAPFSYWPTRPVGIGPALCHGVPAGPPRGRAAPGRRAAPMGASPRGSLQAGTGREHYQDRRETGFLRFPIERYGGRRGGGGIMANQELAARILNENVLIPMLVFSGIILIVAMKTVAAVLKTAARERSRREIAAFIAEGTISPEQGERLMKAEPKN